MGWMAINIEKIMGGLVTVKCKIRKRFTGLETGGRWLLDRCTSLIGLKGRGRA